MFKSNKGRRGKGGAACYCGPVSIHGSPYVHCVPAKNDSNGHIDVTSMSHRCNDVTKIQDFNSSFHSEEKCFSNLLSTLLFCSKRAF